MQASAHIFAVDLAPPSDQAAGKTSCLTVTGHNTRAALEQPVILAILGTTTAAAFGLILAVAKGLFPSRYQPAPSG